MRERASPHPPSVDVRVLGPVAATRGGREVALGGRRQRMVLAALVAARGRVLPADRLRELVWGDGDRTASRATLHGYVAGLRRALEPDRPARAGGILVREGPGYALRLPAGHVDAERFAATVAHAGALLETGRAVQAVSTLESGLALWRGPAYAGLGSAPFALPEIARLDGLRATAVELRLAALIDLGRHDAVLGDLSALVIAHPLRERASELLALALHRAGRPGDALAVIRRARATLSERLGIDPGPGLRRVESAVLDGTPVATRPVAVRTVPAPASSFVGRAAELAGLGAALAAYRLVTLTGPAGVGKSRLAREAARRRADPDGPWLVELAGAGDPAGVVADALGLPPGTPDQLATLLAPRETLLVLDDADHLLAGVVPLVGTLLSRCPRLRILVTSREALDVPEEHLFGVAPLPVPDAVALLAERMRAVAPAAVADPTLAARVCAELDCLPLAIELAAGQCRALSLAEVAEGLADRFGLLAAGPHRPERHRTLAGAIARSYRTLDGPERALLHRLSALDRGFDLDDVRRLGGTAAFAGLVRKSLVADGGGPHRFRLLRTVREYAARSGCGGPPGPGRGGYPVVEMEPSSGGDTMPASLVRM